MLSLFYYFDGKHKSAIALFLKERSHFSAAISQITNSFEISSQVEVENL
ncbi:hypothetical protein Q5691_26015 [Microcoleus sp. w1-18aA5]